MHTVLGLLGLVAYMACAIALAAGMTWLVITVLPTPGGDRKTKTPS
jgi:hypothetical protein